MSSSSVRVLAAVVSAVCVVAVYVLAYLLVGGHDSHGHAGLVAAPAVSSTPAAGAELAAAYHSYRQGSAGAPWITAVSPQPNTVTGPDA